MIKLFGGCHINIAFEAIEDINITEKVIGHGILLTNSQLPCFLISKNNDIFSLGVIISIDR